MAKKQQKVPRVVIKYRGSDDKAKTAFKKRTHVLKAETGNFMGIPIADPAVKPRGTTVKKIREAVAAARKRA
jgi:hypothetical protein